MDELKKLLSFAVQAEATMIVLREGQYCTMDTDHKHNQLLDQFQQVELSWIETILSNLHTDKEVLEKALSGESTLGKFHIRHLGDAYVVSVKHPGTAMELRMFFGESAARASVNTHESHQQVPAAVEQEVAQEPPMVPPLPPIPTPPAVPGPGPVVAAEVTEPPPVPALAFSSLPEAPASDMGSSTASAQGERLEEGEEEDVSASLLDSFNREVSRRLNFLHKKPSAEDKSRSSFDDNDDADAIAFSALPSQIHLDEGPNNTEKEPYQEVAREALAETGVAEIGEGTEQRDLFSQTDDENEDFVVPGALSETYKPDDEELQQLECSQVDGSELFSQLHATGSGFDAGPVMSKEGTAAGAEATEIVYDQDHLPMTGSVHQSKQDVEHAESSQGDETADTAGGDAVQVSAVLEEEYQQQDIAEKLAEKNEEELVQSSLEPSSVDQTSFVSSAPTVSGSAPSSLSLSSNEDGGEAVESSQNVETMSADLTGVSPSFASDRSAAADVVDTKSHDAFLHSKWKREAQEFGSVVQQASESVVAAGFESLQQSAVQETLVEGSNEREEREKREEGEAVTVPGSRLTGVLERFVRSMVEKKAANGWLTSFQKAWFYKDRQGQGSFENPPQVRAEDLYRAIAMAAPWSLKKEWQTGGQVRFECSLGPEAYMISAHVDRGQVYVQVEDARQSVVTHWESLHLPAGGKSVQALVQDLSASVRAGGLYVMSSYGGGVSARFAYDVLTQTGDHGPQHCVMLESSHGPWRSSGTALAVSRYELGADEDRWQQAITDQSLRRGVDLLWIHQMPERVLAQSLDKYVLPLTREGVKVVLNLTVPSAYLAMLQLISYAQQQDQQALGQEGHALKTLVSAMRWWVAGMSYYASYQKSDRHLFEIHRSSADMQSWLLTEKALTAEGFYGFWHRQGALSLDMQLYHEKERGHLTDHEGRLYCVHHQAYQALSSVSSLKSAI